jgi:hypothetical protein
MTATQKPETNAFETTEIRGGIRVLAKHYKGELYAVTYANRTQAERKRAELVAQGVEASLCQIGRPIFIRIA